MTMPPRVKTFPKVATKSDNMSIESLWHRTCQQPLRWWEYDLPIYWLRLFWIWPMHLNIVSRDCGNMWTLHKTLSWSDDPGKEDYRRRCSKFKVKSDEYSSSSPYKQLLICSGCQLGRLFLILIQFIAYSALRPTIQIAAIWIWVWNEYECERMWLKWWFLHFVVWLLDWACLIQYKHPKAWSPEGEIL